jgi:peptidoglycan/xylan/chitin deacetylase (PgdA/CDA1 family)
MPGPYRDADNIPRAMDWTAVSVTFDNLGEAAEVGAGIYEQPLGRHFTVIDVLPRLLELLGGHGISATFFVEAFNAEANPRALERLRAEGHEVACHAWQHEHWAALDADRERELLVRCRDALRPAGFRPPGGQLTQRTPELLRELGFRYSSPAGRRAGVEDGLAVLPFRWRLIDAYHYLPQFETLRRRNGDTAGTLPPAALREALMTALDRHAAQGGHLALLFHPFLVTVDDEAIAVIDDVLARIGVLGLDCVRMDEAAERLLGGAAEAGRPVLDTGSWM